MSDRIAIEDALMRGPSSDGLIAAALDFYRENECMTYWEAVCEVHRVVDAGFAARDLARAARIMAPTSPLHKRMMKQVLAMCHDYVTSDTLLILIDGSAPPKLAGTPNHVIRSPANEVVTVGARWVIQVAEQIIEHAK